MSANQMKLRQVYICVEQKKGNFELNVTFLCCLSKHSIFVVYSIYISVQLLINISMNKCDPLHKDQFPFHEVILYANKKTVKIAYKFSIKVWHNNVEMNDYAVP